MQQLSYALDTRKSFHMSCVSEMSYGYLASTQRDRGWQAHVQHHYLSVSRQTLGPHLEKQIVAHDSVMRKQMNRQHLARRPSTHQES